MIRPIRAVAAMAVTISAATSISTPATSISTPTTSISTPATASTATDGLIVLDDFKTGQVYTVNQSGTNLTQVTHVTGDSFAVAPRWSPDGRRIAFVIVANGLDRIYTMAANGSGIHQLRSETPTWNDDTPDYFPSGNRIVFSRCHSDGSGCVIAVVGINGTGLQTLTSLRFEVFDVSPTVSPDGSRIAFTRFNADGVHARVWVMNADGTGAHAVTAPALETNLPYWTPDGTHLTVSSNCCRLGGDVYRVPGSGKAPTQLTHTPWPLFSSSGVSAPSGSKIGFVSNRNYPDRSGADLFVMNANGSHQVKVKTGLTGVGVLDWAPSTAG